ncbi:MAG: UPF0149 family protein [Tatlockia sp.]|nr:UPF0149 family protein [Tatlockia sp.]
MPSTNNLTLLPTYQSFIDTISALDLPISGSQLHGIMCGYLCAGTIKLGEVFLRSLSPTSKDEATRAALLTLFEVYTVSHQQLINFNFEFQMMLPEDHEPLQQRAKAFCEWCEGFIQSLTKAGISFNQLEEEESKDALQHMLEFAELDYETLNVDEEDERALMEVSEYARMAVLRLYEDLLSADENHGSPGISH